MMTSQELRRAAELLRGAYGVLRIAGHRIGEECNALAAKLDAEAQEREKA